MTHRLRAIAAAVALSALVLAACAGNADAGRIRPTKPHPTATPRPTVTLAPTPSPTPPAAGFVTRNGTALLLNGQPFDMRGFNVYNANSRGNCWYSLGYNDGALDTVLSDVAGTNTIRAWFFQREATTNGARDYSAFDHTLAVAAAHGIKIIATLGNQWGDCEDGVYKDESWYASGYLASYRQFVINTVTRYRDDPTIASWQLMNEAEDLEADRSTCSSTAESTMYAWAVDMAAAVKTADPNHLLNLGSMSSGQCGTSSDTSFQHLLSIPQIDLAEYHDYGSPSVAMPGDQWNGMQVRLDQANAAGKPIFVGEVGITLASAGGSLQQRADWLGAKVSTQTSAGYVGHLVWDWRDPSQPPSTDFEVTVGDPAIAALIGS